MLALSPALWLTGQRSDSRCWKPPSLPAPPPPAPPAPPPTTPAPPPAPPRSALSATLSADSAPDSAAVSAGYSATLSARSAADSAADSAAAAWQAVDADVARLTAGIDHPALLAIPLWPDGPPQGLAENWPILRDALLADDPLWRVWTDWYQDRLDGRPMNVALEVEKALIPDDDWKQDPAHVNPIIADLIAKHASRGTPQAEILSLDPATGKISVERTEVRPRSNLENICDKIRDRIEDLKPRWKRKTSSPPCGR